MKTGIFKIGDRVKIKKIDDFIFLGETEGFVVGFNNSSTFSISVDIDEEFFKKNKMSKRILNFNTRELELINISENLIQYEDWE